VAEVEWTLAAQVRSASGETRVAQAVWRVKAEPAWSGAAWSATDKVIAESEKPAQAAAAPKARHAAWPIRE
jgi:hypothetical protein